LKDVKKAVLNLSLAVAVFTGGCAITPPVQEMSNARQSLNAAKAVQADIHDPDTYKKAAKLIELAKQHIEQGDYTQAREYAINAKQIAIKARQQTLSKTQN